MGLQPPRLPGVLSTRWALAFAGQVLLWLTLVCPQLAWAAADLSTPRATLRTFLESVREARSGDLAALDEAAKCLDLSDVPAPLRLDTGRALARELSDVLDKTRRVRPDDVPEAPRTSRVVVAKVLGQELVLTRQDDASASTPNPNDSAGNEPRAARSVWRFDLASVHALPSLGKALRDRPWVVPRARAVWTESLLTTLPPELERSFLDVEVWQWCGLALLLLTGWVVGRLLALLISGAVRRGLRRSDYEIDATVVGKTFKPLGIVLGSLAVLYGSLLLQLPPTAQGWTSTITRGLVVLGGFLLGSRLIGLVGQLLSLRAAQTASKLDDQLVPLVSKALRFLLFVMAALVLADAAGFELTGALATLGIGGVALALAAKDTVENLFGTVTVLLDKPFEVGDLITIGGTTGTVEHIGFRSTRLRTLHNSQVTVPNSKLIGSEVDNLGRRTRRKMELRVSLTYQSTPAQLQAFVAGLQTLFADHPHVDDDYVCGVYDLAASSIEVHLTAHLHVATWREELLLRQELLLAMLRLAEALGLEFAFPTQTVLHAAATSQHNPARVDRNNPVAVGVQAARALPDVARQPQSPLEAGAPDAG